MWGWTAAAALRREQDGVNPTYVGMDRPGSSGRFRRSSKPHVCGDGPDRWLAVRRFFDVNPTYVGMDRQSQHISALLNGKPHARGDEP